MDALDRLKDGMDRLTAIALAALPEMYDPGTGLFSNKTTIAGDAYVNSQPNVLYSAASLAGLLSQRRTPAEDLIPLGAALDALYEATIERDRVAELGLLGWVTSLAEDPRATEVTARLCEVEPRPSPSGALGMAIRGLTAGAAANPADRDRALTAAQACAAELLFRFDASRDVFRGSPRRLIPRREVIERGLTSFASQVYPLQGLASLYEATGESPPEALARAARRQVEMQGAMGQWWWIWSTRRRTVLEGYPVYSVHQDGMAFMGLMPLEPLGIGCFHEPLATGLDWIFGANELGVSLVEESPPLIYRCIQRQGSDADGPYGLSAAGFRKVVARSLAPSRTGDRTIANPARLEVLKECRSYHLGWLLYADSLVQAARPADSGNG